MGRETSLRNQWGELKTEGLPGSNSIDIRKEKMPTIVEVLNPFNPQEREFAKALEGESIRDWLREKYPDGEGGFVEFTYPTICVLNGSPLLRKDWGRMLKKGDL